MYSCFSLTRQQAKNPCLTASMQRGFAVATEVSSVAGTTGAAAKSPVITVDKLGRVYVAWAENRDGAVDTIFFARGE
jgi:hypothetical protein